MRRALLALCLLCLLPASAHAAACPARAQCGRLTVPLDRSGRTPGTLPLAYARYPATGPRAGTLVVLSGGPGEAAIAIAPEVEQRFAPLRRSYDLIYVDQRGTGRSGAVDCGESDALVRTAAGCAQALGGERGFLTTAETARDLEDLRGALGADRLTLLGISYGTLVAEEYARRFPEHTAAVILDSPVAGAWLDGLGSPAPGTLARVLGEICAGACGVRDPGAALAAAAGRVRGKGLPTRVVTTSGGRLGRTRVTEEDLLAALLGSDEEPAQRAALPAAIASLAAGDGAPFAHPQRVADRALAAADAPFSFARFFATACQEIHFPWASDSPVAGRRDALRSALAQRGAAGFAPFTPSVVVGFSLVPECLRWPPTPPPEPEPADPDVPVLLLSGREDLRTPLEDAEATAARYARATLVAVPGVGHSVLVNDGGGCALRAALAFLGSAPVDSCAGQPATRSRPAPAAIVPVRLLPGRAAADVALTLSGIAEDLDAAPGAAWLPGLRRGTFRLRGRRVRLAGVEWVGGVRLTGSLGAGHGRLSVTGAVRGRLTERHGRLAGRLGGRRVRLALPVRMR